jgi:hypothetical protein
VCTLGGHPSVQTQTGEKTQLKLGICFVYVHNTILTAQSYVYNIVIYITQDKTETTDEDTRQAIVPLVLPTQLESEDSDSDCEDRSKDDPEQGVDQKPEEYDEDVDGAETQDTFKGNKVGNDEAQLRVSDHYTVILILYLKHDKQNSPMFMWVSP